MAELVLRIKLMLLKYTGNVSFVIPIVHLWYSDRELDTSDESLINEFLWSSLLLDFI